MTRNHDHRFLPEKLDNEVPVPIAGGAYVATPVVAMSAPMVGSSTCHWATIKADGMPIAAWHTPTTPSGAYMRVPGKAWLILQAERSLSCNCPFNR